MILQTAAGYRRWLEGHDGERMTRRGMVKIGSGSFATPGSKIAATVRLAKQVEIAASHEVEACSHQANRAVAEVVRLPGWARRNVRAAKQHARDVSIRFAGVASIKRSQSEPEPSTLVLRKAIGCTATTRSARSKPPQAGRSLSSNGEACIDRNDNCCRRVGARGVDEHGGQSTVEIVDEPIFAFDGSTLEYRSQAADATRIIEQLWCSCDNNRRRIEARQPDQRRSVPAEHRIDRET